MPKQTPDLPLPTIQLDASSALPLHRQLYNQLRDAIREGHLKPGMRLPSTRALAQELGVSRATTIEAYRDLHAEGYLDAQIGAGTVVMRKLPEQFLNAQWDQKSDETQSDARNVSPPASVALRLSQQGARLAAMSPPAWFFASSTLRPFRLGVPALEAVPQQAWARAIARAARRPTPRQLDYQPAAGYRPLREEIAAYLAVARGVRCTADQVIVVAGIQAGLSLATSLLVDANDVVWIEDPGYFLAQAIFQAAGVDLAPVPIDSEGLDIGAGIARAPDARLAYVTPSHQFPLGVTMSQLRRYELLHWARQRGAWIIEDDYDSEFRYVGRPIPALQGLDEAGRVIYMGTFSKVFFPALRLGYLVVPPSLVDLFTVAQRVMSFHPPMLEQMAMAAFMETGDFTRHIRRMRNLYTERRDALLTYAPHYLADKLQIAKTPAGLHLIGWLAAGLDEQSMVLLAGQQDVTVYALSSFRLKPAEPHGVVLGFAAFDERAIKAGVQQLALAWGR